MTTTPTASAVTSLFCPIAMPTVAAHHSRGVIDAIPDVQCFGHGSFGADDGELLFRTLLRVDLRDAHLLREIAHLRLVIARHDHDPLELVLGAQMLHEGETLRSRRITKAQGRRVALTPTTHSSPAASAGS